MSTTLVINLSVVSIIILLIDVSFINLFSVNDGGFVVVLQPNVIVKPKTDMKFMNLKLMAGNSSIAAT